MADNSSPSDTSETGGLSTDVFIAIISSVCAVIFLLALLMICSFVIFCYREYRKRNCFSQKESDRIGLLHTKGGDEDVISDQFEEDSKEPPVEGAEFKAVEKKPPLKAGSKVAPQTRGEGDAAVQYSGTNNRKGTKSAASQGEETKKDEGLIVTMIGEADDDDDDEEEVCELNAGMDDLGDGAQLIPSKKKKTTHKTIEVDLQTKATLLGRPVSYVEQLSKSSPLDTEGINQVALDEHGTSFSNPLVREYKGIPSNAAELPNQSAAERAKNRYRNVLPNPHSMVHLKSTGVDGSTYINANFIRGLYGEKAAFIASQGPIFETMSDFWRMVWEHDVNIIVMLTNLIENGRHKCVKYWPPVSGADKVTHDNMEVTSVGEDKNSSYTLSNLILKNLETGETRTVYHFWYVAWPDFGIPSTAEHILKLQKAVEECRTKSHAATPVVVHCSAGLGRSGAFIAIDMGVKQYQEEGLVDPLKYLCEMRQDRGGMIQTSDQYLFVHKALAEYMNN